METGSVQVKHSLMRLPGAGIVALLVKPPLPVPVRMAVRVLAAPFPPSSSSCTCGGSGQQPKYWGLYHVEDQDGVRNPWLWSAPDPAVQVIGE